MTFLSERSGDRLHVLRILHPRPVRRLAAKPQPLALGVAPRLRLGLGQGLTGRDLAAQRRRERDEAAPCLRRGALRQGAEEGL